MRKHYLAFLLLTGSATLHHAALAQAPQATRLPARELADDGTPTLIRLGAGAKAYAASQARQALTQELGLRADDAEQLVATDADPLGFVHEKYQQYYRGIKVEHATYTAHGRRGALESLSGRLTRVPADLSPVPALTAAAALGRALAFVGAKQYMWDAEHDAALRPQGELVIVQPRNLKPGQETGAPVLAWKFNVYAAEPLSRAYLYVDARSGEVVLKDDIIKHAAADGSFSTRYSGTQSSTTDSDNGSYRLRDYSRGNGVETYNCKQASSYTGAVDFTDNDNSWTEYDNAAFDNAALDAHWGAQAVYDYWKNVQGRNSYDGKGTTIKSYVHYGKSYENAFWNGSVMTYGDGASTFRPLTALDVCAHEIGHAVCATTANLTYSNESGALNEGLSDIWGAVVENYRAPDKQPWLIGEDIIKPAGYTCLRSMSDPTGSEAYSRCPAYYKGNRWYSGTSDNGGVHTNSGVLNHWFYILSVGKSGTNEGGNAYAVTGIGIGDAAKITFRMESVYMTAGTTFAQARTFAIQAATDLFGATAAQTTAVANAWYAVGVGEAASPTPTTGTFSGVYKLTARHSGKALDVNGVSTNDGANVHQWEYVGQTNQQWKIESVGDGYYKLTAQHSGKALDVSGSGTANGTNVQQWTDNGTAAQQWAIEATSDGYYKLLNRNSGKCLDVDGGPSATNNGTNVHQWDYAGGTNQQWKIESVSSGVAGLTDPAATRLAQAVVVLYPNPARGEALVQGAANEELRAVLLTDALGRAVSGPSRAERLRPDAYRLRVDGLRAGLYLVRVTTATGQTQTHKLHVE